MTTIDATLEENLNAASDVHDEAEEAYEVEKKNYEDFQPSAYWEWRLDSAAAHLKNAERNWRKALDAWERG